MYFGVPGSCNPGVKMDCFLQMISTRKDNVMKSGLQIINENSSTIQYARERTFYNKT